MPGFGNKGATLPAKVTQSQGFFVVGGPVQPDRACYVRRKADEELLEAIAARRFASVFAPRALGKSSLMGRTIRRLRADGQLAAVVDLAQIGSRGENVDAARWHYSIAYRICRELRLRVDLQAWWHDKSLLLNEQRLAEFLFDIVLANTAEPVTIFFDEVERAAELAFSGELFAAIYSCYMRRVSEPDFERLNFVALGAASPEQLCADPDVSPFVSGVAIALEDFTLDECAALAPGLAGAEAPAESLLARIHAWTHGQPYLTQKLARGVARRGGRLGDVDTVLHELFLAPGISREEPLLGYMHACLGGDSPRSRQAARILVRLGRGNEVIYDPASAAQTLLRLCGLTSSDDNGMLRFRNRIVEHVFDSDWARSGESRRWQRPAAIAAAIVAALVLLPYWYIAILPARDVATLETVTSDYELALAAHRRLGRLPGFGGRADRLLATVMRRRSTEARSFDDVLAADAVLRGLGDGEALADELMAGFWLRQAEAAAHRDERDAALAYALAAADAGSVPAAHFAAALIDGDYRSLGRTIHLDSPPLAVEVDWEHETIALVDQTRLVRRISLAASGSVGADPGLRLSAPQHVGVTRTVFVDDPGSAATLELRLTVSHPRSEDLLVRLQAPSGAAAEVALPHREGRLQQFVFTPSARNGLLGLADESIIGNWELTVFDRLSGESGVLLGWGLGFRGVPQVFEDDLGEGIALPDPVRTEQVDVVLAAGGELAVAIPSRPDSRGAASVYDLESGALLADLPLADRDTTVRFIGPDRLLFVGSHRASLWRVGDSEPLNELVAATGFIAEPAVSPGGDFFALGEWAGETSRISVVSTDDGMVANRFDAAPWQAWALGDEGAMLALVDGSNRGRLIDARTGDLVAELYHERELERVFADRGSGGVVTVDRGGEIFAWPIDSGRRTLTPGDSIFLGRTAAAESMAVALDNTAIAYVASDGIVAVRNPADGELIATLDHGSGRGTLTRLGADAQRLVTLSDDRLRYWELHETLASGPDFGDVSAVAFERNGSVGVLGYRSGAVRLLRGLPEALERPAGMDEALIGHRGVVTALALDASGTLAASGGSDGTVRLWDSHDGARRPVLLRHPAGPIVSLAFSPDGVWIASAGPTSMRLFAVATGALVNELEVDGAPLSLAFSPDSRVVAVGDSAGNIFLATPGSEAGVVAIRGRSPVTALAFGDVPGLLASGTAAGDLVLWDTLTLNPVEGAHRFPAAVSWIATGVGAAEILVRSGLWLHTLDRSGQEAQNVRSQLLPDRFRSGAVLARLEDGRLRGFVRLGGGRLAFGDIGLDPYLVAPAADTVASRDWLGALGLRLDTRTGRLEKFPP